MFDNAIAFNQDLSSWCVKNVMDYSEYNHDTIMENNEAYQPKWGETCPQKKVSRKLLTF